MPSKRQAPEDVTQGSGRLRKKKKISEARWISVSNGRPLHTGLGGLPTSVDVERFVDVRCFSDVQVRYTHFDRHIVQGVRDKCHGQCYEDGAVGGIMPLVKLLHSSTQLRLSAERVQRNVHGKRFLVTSDAALPVMTYVAYLYAYV